MFDIGFHQGAGLHSHTPQDPLRLVAIASNHNNVQGLETLWQVCLHLQHLGYPVVVLDGTACETESSPGLRDLLDNSPWVDALPSNATTNASSLAVIPALQGLRVLSLPSPLQQHPLQGLQPLFRRYALVVVYAPIATLASPLLEGSGATPLLVSAAGKQGVVQSYRQLKYLALHSGLSAMVACVAHPSAPGQQQLAQDSLHSLRQCASRHLGQQLRTSLIQAGRPQDLQRLALQLLENACAIDAPCASTTLISPHSAGTPAHFVQSH